MKTVTTKALDHLAFLLPWKVSVQNNLSGLKEKQALWEINKLLLLKITKEEGTAGGLEVDWSCLLLKPCTVIIAKRFIFFYFKKFGLCFIFTNCSNALQQCKLVSWIDEKMVIKKFNICKAYEDVQQAPALCQVIWFICSQHWKTPQWPLTSDVIFQTAHIHSQPIWRCGGNRELVMIAG